MICRGAVSRVFFSSFDRTLCVPSFSQFLNWIKRGSFLPLGVWSSDGTSIVRWGKVQDRMDAFVLPLSQNEDAICGVFFRSFFFCNKPKMINFCFATPIHVLLPGMALRTVTRHSSIDVNSGQQTQVKERRRQVLSLRDVHPNEAQMHR